MTDFLPGLIRAATKVDGQPPFSDQSLVDYSAGTRRLLTVAEGGEPLGATLVVVGKDGSEAELVVHPDARRRGLGERLLGDVIAAAHGTLLIWAHGDHPGARALAAKFGFEPVRKLLQLRAAVPETDTVPVSEAETVPEADTVPVPEVETVPEADTVPELVEGRGTRTIRPFRPGVDDSDWLALNAQAFADHAEQGKLKQRDLNARMTESWFDADDFLLLWEGDELIGFCWLKVEGALGEFYAVGVAPGRQGEGLGRILVEAGLGRLAARGIRESNLYVEADNEPAVRLYRSYGFTNHTVDVQYRRESARSGG